MKVLGISGRKLSGKDTAATAIIAAVPGAVRRGFADALKDEVAKALGVSVEYVEGHKNQLRGLLQHWGTEWRRSLCDPDYWVLRMREFLSTQSATPLVVIPDVRFENEAALVKEFGGLVLRVVNPGLDFDSDHHTSETALVDYPFDARIVNDCGLVEYERRCRDWWAAQAT